MEIFIDFIKSLKWWQWLLWALLTVLALANPTVLIGGVVIFIYLLGLLVKFSKPPTDEDIYTPELFESYKEKERGDVS